MHCVSFVCCVGLHTRGPHGAYHTSCILDLHSEQHNMFIFMFIMFSMCISSLQRPVKMHAIVMAMLEAAMEAAVEGTPEEAQVSNMVTHIADTLWQEMPHEWIAFVSNVLQFNQSKKLLVGLPPAIKNEALLTVSSFFDNDSEAEKFLGRRAAYALHLFTQTCSGEEKLVNHEYGLVLFHLQAHQEALAKADRKLQTKEEWVLFWSALLQSVDEVLQQAPLEGLGRGTKALRAPKGPTCQ